MARRAYSILMVCLLAISSRAQTIVAPCTDWLATVDESSQQIVLSWRPSTDTAAMGYHICTGSPCLDFDTVFGRMDTMYICASHSATEQHLYRLHVFDSARNVSALTPSFGNMVLRVEAAPCDSVATFYWTPYQGMPNGVGNYTVMLKLEPGDGEFVAVYTTDSTGTLSFRVPFASSVTRFYAKVLVQSLDRRLASQSNLVSFTRTTADTAGYLSIASVEYDSVRVENRLVFNVDTTYSTDHYYLYRSVDGTPWQLIATLEPPLETYIDATVNPYDSLHCYQLEVYDACGLNPKYSATRCVVVPTPPEPSVYFPNAILIDDPHNGYFLPIVRGLQGTLYELYIYNRMGMVVFHTTDPTQAWVPTAKTPQGVYTYRLRCRFNTNFIKNYIGTILLIK